MRAGSCPNMWTSTRPAIFKDDPFQTLDVDGVGMLIKWAIEQGRKTRPKLKIGICGEHGGDARKREILPPVGNELRERLALPRADRAAGRGAGRNRREEAPQIRGIESARVLKIACAEDLGELSLSYSACAGNSGAWPIPASPQQCKPT